MKIKNYKIEITPITQQKFCAVKPYSIEFSTGDIEWTMEQYQRNRDPFTWKII